MNLFQVLEIIDCSEEILGLIGIVKFVLNLIQWVIPIVLVVLCTIDMFKAMTSGDEKAIKAAQKQAIMRIVYALVIFLIPFLVRLAFSLIGSLSVSGNDSATISGDFWSCWGTSKTTAQTDKACYVDGSKVVNIDNKNDCDNVDGDWK